ncbi:MAG: hypothetical protein HFE58_11520 [Firmicutes bacterium]|jgi:hypothetical protein|nr:hypothetical protein [Bacillota bacterium]
MKTFKEEYETQIEPYLKQIDIFLKTKKPPYSISKTAELLHISQSEIKRIMTKENVTTIDQKTFFTIMKNGSSTLCHIFARELYCGIPQYYTAENISYIYNLDISTVLQASQQMGLNKFSPGIIKTLFHFIPIQK